MSDQFDFGVRAGMTVIVVASAASAFAVGGVLLYIAYSAVTIQRNASRRWSTDTHIHYYFLNLMVSDLIQAVGGLLNIKWIVEASVYPCPFCTVQGTAALPLLYAGLSLHVGFFKQVGDVGVALSTMAIALHMLQVLVLGWRSPPKFALLILAIIWLSILILVVVPNVAQHNIYGPTGYWCWIDGSTAEQIGLDYMWMWLAAVLNIISYLFLVFVIKRAARADGNSFRWWGKQERRSVSHASTIGGFSGQITLQLPPGVLPISAARFSEFSGRAVPFAVTAFADTLFASSGLFDTILYASTRPRLMPRRPSHDPQSDLIARIATVRVVHSRFPQDYMMEDGSFVTDTGRPMFHDMPNLLRSSTSPRT
ncbi:hypothetical protein PISMIDRAFT_18340 [Pisolithus microcarpus 441]|uniref:Glucose receptor Git3 N-terminal domain-containing protein n=1 Tax=Pisolithus microcarpus 441 TaxID=765257 RepID=A0A0C9XKY1_9AGAM|nr:hypothetical protein PISMIDRAFT_18340 [Pisolithus microcarpus 441]